MDNSVNIIEATPTPATLTANGKTLSDYGQEFIKFCDVKPLTLKGYIVGLKCFFSYLTEKQITYPDTDDIIAFKGDALAKYSAGTVSFYMAAIRLFFRWTAQKGYYRNIADHVRGAKINRTHKRDALTAEQLQIILSTIDRSTVVGKRDYAIIALMANCALRDIEIVRANVGDFQNMALQVLGKGKDETDQVQISEQVERIIRTYLATRTDTGAETPLFVSESTNCRGDRLTARSISKIVKRRMIDAGYNSDRLTAHSLRHTGITLYLLANGNNIQEAATFARHTDIATTMIYSHNIDQTAIRRKGCNAVAAAIFGTEQITANA